LIQSSIQPVGHVAALARYPVKSMAGEQLAEAPFGPLGIHGDRRWALYTEDGGIASGKTTRRFRRVDRLFHLQARLDTELDVPTVWLPDGRRFQADDPAASAAISALLKRPLQLRPESAVRHHDESRVHVITTAGVRELERTAGEPIDAARFRANVVLAVEGTGFIEDGWHGRTLALGDDVRLALGRHMPRCVMVGLAQPHAGLATDPRLLKQLARVHELQFGLTAEVIQGGVVRPGDTAILS
jgi:uncharacterized protein YcbX